jgi:excisionase family DNA binding protein
VSAIQYSRPRVPNTPPARLGAAPLPDNRPSPDPWVSVIDIARELGVSKMTVYRLLKAREIRSLKVGRSFRVRKSWVLAYIAQGGST